MKCLNCGKEYTPLTVVQKYCSSQCGLLYRREHVPMYPVLEFDCAYCGRHVVTDGIRDKRSRFCCEKCERKFWKHRSSRKKPHVTQKSGALNPPTSIVLSTQSGQEKRRMYEF